MKVILYFLGLVLGSLANNEINNKENNNTTICVKLSDLIKVFPNICHWCDTQGVADKTESSPNDDREKLAPICAENGTNFFTFPNKFALEESKKETGIEWKVVFNGICSTNPDDALKFLPSQLHSSHMPSSTSNSSASPQPVSLGSQNSIQSAYLSTGNIVQNSKPHERTFLDSSGPNQQSQPFVPLPIFRSYNFDEIDNAGNLNQNTMPNMNTIFNLQPHQLPSKQPGQMSVLAHVSESYNIFSEPKIVGNNNNNQQFHHASPCGHYNQF